MDCANPQAPHGVPDQVLKEAPTPKLGTASTVMLIIVLTWSVLLLPLDGEVLEDKDGILVTFLSPVCSIVPGTLLRKYLQMNKGVTE